MKPFSKLALSFALVALSSTCSWAQSGAETSDKFGAGFMLADTPNLRVGSALFDSDRTTVGSWTSDNKTDTHVFARELTDSGWSSWNGNENMHRSRGFPLHMGESVAYLNRGLTTGNAGVFYTSLGASLATNPQEQSEANASASWSRDFQIDANSSLIFSGTASITYQGLNLLTFPSKSPYSPAWFYPGKGYGFSAELGDLDSVYSFGTALTGSLSDKNLDPTNVFSYSADSRTGALVMTVTNTSNLPIFGTLGVSSWANITPAVPEPETYATLLVGLGVVGAVARRRRALATASV
jgi:hypothetical protein